jgi:hypothetical protein
MLTNQSHAVVGHDMAGRDLHSTTNYLNFPSSSGKTQIARLYEKFREEIAGAGGGVSEIIEDLQHYLDKPARQMDRTLEDKLNATGRDNLVEEALEDKERAMKRIVRFQGSRAAQEIFAYVLGDIHARFSQHIKPLLASGASRQVVDSAVFELVIRPISEEMEPSDLGLNSSQVKAMLYCLAGNCHIRWD